MRETAGIGMRDIGSSAMDFGLKMMGLLEKHYPVCLPSAMDCVPGFFSRTVCGATNAGPFQFGVHVCICTRMARQPVDKGFPRKIWHPGELCGACRSGCTRRWW